MKKIKQFINETICKIIGHRIAFRIESRKRYKRFLKVGHYVDGGYTCCVRCGKKLSNFERLK